MRRTVSVAMAAALTAAPAAVAEPGARPELFRALVDCRAITDAGARLACFDKAVAAVDAAEQSRDLVVVDRGQVRKARRSLFGFTLPSLDIFGGGKKADAEEEPEFEAIEAKIRSASRDVAGHWRIVLEDGARWVQIDSRDLARDPAPGQTIKIRKAAMGSYFGNVAGQIAIRMRRES